MNRALSASRRRDGFVFGLRWLITFSAIAAMAALPDTDGVAHFTVGEMLVSLFLIALTLFASYVNLRNLNAHPRPATLDQREIEAKRLRALRERTQLIYAMANTLGATLNYERVLNAALDVGVLGLKELGEDNRMIGAVLLFQGQDLRVAAARRFTLQDEKTVVPGQRGILGLAINQSEPVFGADARSDPELQYFSGLVEAKSLLAIPLRAGFNKYGVLLFASETPNAFSDDHLELLNSIGTQATIALQNAMLVLNLRKEKDKLIEVEEDARKKLARDLHDGPVQLVASVAMRTNFTRTILERKPEVVPEELLKIEDLAKRATKELRHLLFTLRPLVLENQGLSAALKQMADKMKETYDLVVIVETQPNVDQLLSKNAQGVLFYVVEEAVNNARKHAQAEHHWVRLYKQSDYVVIEVQDDGLGFDLKAVDAGYDKRGSLGMINMRERAELAEGTLNIQSEKGKGTRITVIIPIRPAESGNENGTDPAPAGRS